MFNMIRLFLKLYLIFAIIMFAVLASRSCSSDVHEKKEPEYHGVDPQLQPIVDEYLRLSSENNVVFTNKVTLGMKEIDEGGVVGICNYGKNWREIDVDKGYWDRLPESLQYALLFHELTHCYCGRDHDFAEGKEYKIVKELKEEDAQGIKHQGAGFYKDNCPVSLMYPMVVEPECMNKHYKEYVKEMFDRCEPF